VRPTIVPQANIRSNIVVTGRRIALAQRACPNRGLDVGHAQHFRLLNDCSRRGRAIGRLDDNDTKEYDTNQERTDHASKRASARHRRCHNLLITDLIFDHDRLVGFPVVAHSILLKGDYRCVDPNGWKK